MLKIKIRKNQVASFKKTIQPKARGKKTMNEL